MHKKTFAITTCLLLFCGCLALGLITLGKRADLPWQRPPGTPPVLKVKAHKRGVSNVTFTPDGKSIISVSESITRRDVDSGKLMPIPAALRLMPIPRRVNLGRTHWCMGISPGGKVAAIQRRGTLARTIQQVYWEVVGEEKLTSRGTWVYQYRWKKQNKTYKRELYRNKGIDLYNIQTGSLLYWQLTVFGAFA